jgi:hypothetical protein
MIYNENLIYTPVITNYNLIFAGASDYTHEFAAYQTKEHDRESYVNDGMDVGTYGMRFKERKWVMVDWCSEVCRVLRRFFFFE